MNIITTQYTTISAYADTKSKLERIQYNIRKMDGSNPKHADLIEEAVNDLECKKIFSDTLITENSVQEAMQIIQEMLKTSEPKLGMNIFSVLNEDVDIKLISDVLTECASDLQAPIKGNYLPHLYKLFEKFRILSNYISTFSTRTTEILKDAIKNG